MSTGPLHPALARRRWPSLIVVAVVAVALMASACADRGGEDAGAVGQGDDIVVADAPDWIDKVYPPPGSETSATDEIQINHSAIQPDRQVRLLIDGTDVTAYALETDPGLLVYDPEDPDAPVQLKPGDHTAQVRLVSRTPGVSEGVDSYDPDVHEAIDDYRWEFTVL